MEGDASLHTSRPTLLGRGRDGESRFFESVSSGTQETRQVARGGARRRAFRPQHPSEVWRAAALQSAFRIPGAFPKSLIWRRHPARARDRLPASSGRPASLTCAVDSEALRSKVSLRVSPAALKAQGKRVLSEKIAVGELFRQAGAGGNARFRPLKNPWFWKEPRFLRPSDARNAHEKCCGIRLWGSSPNPGRGMIPLHPALCQQPEAGGNARFFIFI